LLVRPFMDPAHLRDTLTQSSRYLGVWILGALLIATLGACSSPGEPTPDVVTSATPDSGQSGALNVLIGSVDLAVGENRLFFAILDADAEPLKHESVGVSFAYTDGAETTPESELTAVFRQWPYGRGVYTVQVSFDRSGTWRMDVAPHIQGQPLVTSALVQVAQTSATPALGSRPPSSRSKTLSDVELLEELTTDPVPDEELYSMTIAEAMQTGKPLVVTFASPAFCLSATCGPQVDVLKDVKAGYSGTVNFIHVEVFDNPSEMRGDVRKGRLSPTMMEWGLESEPYTFVIDALGNVSAKFEGFATEEELHSAIEDTLS
jgi:hypothetical protein